MGASFCLECKDKTCIKTKKPCEQVEALLRSEGIYSSNWIRPQMDYIGKDGKRSSIPREIPFSSLSKQTKKDMGLTGYLYDNEIDD